MRDLTCGTCGDKAYLALDRDGMPACNGCDRAPTFCVCEADETGRSPDLNVEGDPTRNGAFG